MKKWIKFVGLSFFSDKVSKEAIRRGYLNFAVGLLLSLVFLFCGLLAADVLPFSAHYSNAPDFQEFVRYAFTGNESISLTVVDNKMTTPTNVVVDTFVNSNSPYSINGYNLVVDMRPATAYDDFQAYCISNDGKQQEITYEDYLTLSDVAKRNFDFAIRYTNKQLVLTDQLIENCENYLSERNNEAYANLLKDKSTLTLEDYKKSVYELYVKDYYPDLTKYEQSGNAPLLRNYYYHNYVNTGAEKFLFVFDDSCVVSFQTRSGNVISFYGAYNNLGDGFTIDSADKADSFIKSIFNGTTSLIVYIYIMNILRLLPFILLMPVALALIMFCVLRLMRAEWCRGFGSCLKIVGSYLWVAPIISAIITFISGFFVPRVKLLIAAILIFFAVLLVRTVVMLIMESVRLKKAAASVVNDDQQPSSEQNLEANQ